MSFSFIQLERQLFSDKKEFSSIAIEDINTEISLLEEGNANLRQSMAEKKHVIKSIASYNNDIKEYRKAQIKTITSRAKTANITRNKDIQLLSKFEETLKSVDEKLKQHTAPIEYGIVYIKKYLWDQASIIKRRIKFIKDDMDDCETDKKGFQKLTDEEINNNIQNELILNKRAIDSYEFSIQENKNKIRQLQELKRLIEDGNLIDF